MLGTASGAKASCLSVISSSKREVDTGSTSRSARLSATLSRFSSRSRWLRGSSGSRSSFSLDISPANMASPSALEDLRGPDPQFCPVSRAESGIFGAVLAPALSSSDEDSCLCSRAGGSTVATRALTMAAPFEKAITYVWILELECPSAIMRHQFRRGSISTERVMKSRRGLSLVGTGMRVSGLRTAIDFMSSAARMGEVQQVTDCGRVELSF